MRPIRSPTLLPIRMNAADTSASSAIADWTLLTVVSRSWTTAEMDTFINEVSTTSTNIAIDSRMASRMFNGASAAARARVLGHLAAAVGQPRTDAPLSTRISTAVSMTERQGPGITRPG